MRQPRTLDHPLQREACNLEASWYLVVTSELDRQVCIRPLLFLLQGVENGKKSVSRV